MDIKPLLMRSLETLTLKVGFYYKNEARHLICEPKSICIHVFMKKNAQGVSLVQVSRVDSPGRESKNTILGEKSSKRNR